MTADTDFDFSDVADESQPSESNVMPRTGTSRTGRSTRRGGRPATKRLGTLKENLSKQMFQAGSMIGLGLPVTGYYIASESDNFCDAIVQLAGKKAEWIDALEQLANVGPGIYVGRTVIGIGCAMGVDRWHKSEGQSGINPEKRAAMFLGVTAAYQALYGAEVNDNQSVYAPPPGGSFVPVA